MNSLLGRLILIFPFAIRRLAYLMLSLAISVGFASKKARSTIKCHHTDLLEDDSEPDDEPESDEEDVDDSDDEIPDPEREDPDEEDEEPESESESEDDDGEWWRLRFCTFFRFSRRFSRAALRAAFSAFSFSAAAALSASSCLFVLEE